MSEPTVKVPSRHDYISPSGRLRVHRGHPQEASVPERATLIGSRSPGDNVYVGTARWGRTWSEVQENTELGPMDNPPTVN